MSGNQAVFQSAECAVGPERISLRDGTQCTLRVATREDVPLLRRFVSELSSKSLYQRFFALTPPRDEVLEWLCYTGLPERELTLLVTRMVNGQEELIATASYATDESGRVEIAFAVADAYQGKGLGTLLMERLATTAIQHGISRFWAVTMDSNQAMLNVFRHSGFPMVTRHEGSLVFVELILPPPVPAPSKQRRAIRTPEHTGVPEAVPLEPLLSETG